MGRKIHCGYCGEVFRFKKQKKEHKLKYPNGSCENLKGGEDMEKKEEEEPKEKIEEEKEKKVERKSPIQKVVKILVPKEQAKEEWKKYCQLLKKRKDRHLKILKESMYFAKQGKQFINVYEAMKGAGLSSNNEPRLAIARADIHNVYFEKQDTGTGSFQMENGWNRGGWNTDVILPQKTFKIQWARVMKDDGTPSWEIDEKKITTKVPIIPADLMPEGDLKNYYVLWEVKDWEQLPQPKDPFLLKRISENLFVVFGAWDITELERAILGGLK